MAITINIEPQTLQPVYNQIITVLESTEINKESHSFVVDININGTPESRIKIQSNPEGYGVFDIHRHIEPFITYDISDPLNDLTEIKKASNSFVEYSVTLSEEYIPTIDINSITVGLSVTTSTAHGFTVGDTITILNCDVSNYDGTYTIATVPTSTTFTIAGTHTFNATSGEVKLSNQSIVNFPSATAYTGIKLAFNGVENWVTFQDYLEGTYDILGATYARLLTSLPNYTAAANPVQLNVSDCYEVKSSSRMYLNAWDRNESFNYCSITSYDENGNYIADIDSSAVLAGTTDNYVLRCAVGPWNINNSGNGSGWGSNFLSGASYYTVTVTSDEVSAYYKFKIVDDCTEYEDFQFLFMDRLGSFIPVHFDLVSRKNVSINKTSYRKNIGSYDSTLNTYGYNTYDRGETRIDTKVNEVITVNSDWVSEQKSNIINEMLASPEVYHIDENGVMYAINITTSTYQVKDRKIDKLINHTFNFEYSFKNNQQRG